MKKYTSAEDFELIALPLIEQDFGKLSFGEFDRNLPFLPKRHFLIYDVPVGQHRGRHAHFECEQLAICVKGSVAMTVEFNKTRKTFALSKAHQALYLPPLTWVEMNDFSQDCVLLVFASHYYEPKDYIRDYAEYHRALSKV